VTAPVRPFGQDILGRRPSARAVTAALVVTVLVALAGLVLTGLEWSSLATSDGIGSVGAVAGSIAYAALGALIVRRAGNLVGWFMLAEGASNAVMTSGHGQGGRGRRAGHPAADQRRQGGISPAQPRPGTEAQETVLAVMRQSLRHSGVSAAD
jgi:hypothetical protein